MNAPVVPVDLFVDAELGVMWPCTDCLPYHFEVIVDGDGVFLRGWHAIDCRTLADILAAISGGAG